MIWYTYFTYRGVFGRKRTHLDLAMEYGPSSGHLRPIIRNLSNNRVRVRIRSRVLTSGSRSPSALVPLRRAAALALDAALEFLLSTEALADSGACAGMSLLVPGRC